MPGPAITKGSDHFFNVLYEGNGGGQRVGNFVPFTDNGTISNSVIFNYDEAHILEKTFGSAGTSRKKYTFSVWCKLGRKLGSEERRIIMVGPVGNDDGFRLDDDNTIHIWQNGISASRLYTNRTFEDTSKFYHFVLAVDTTQATEANRVRMYVDGDEIPDGKKVGDVVGGTLGGIAGGSAGGAGGCCRFSSCTSARSAASSSRRA